MARSIYTGRSLLGSSVVFEMKYWIPFPMEGNEEAGYYTDNPPNDYWVQLAREGLENMTLKQRERLLKEFDFVEKIKIQKYVLHLPTCEIVGWNFPKGPCTCGLLEALK